MAADLERNWRSGVVELEADEQGVVELSLGAGRMFKLRLLRDVKLRFCSGNSAAATGEGFFDFYLHVAQNSIGGWTVDWLDSDNYNRPVYLVWEGGTTTQNVSSFGSSLYHFITPDRGRTLWGFRRTNYAALISGDTLFADESTLHKSGNTISVKSGGIGSVQLSTNAVANSNFRQSQARSIVGRSSDTVGNVADIVASVAGHVLRLDASGTTLGFGTIDGSSLAADAITTSKILNGAITASKLSSSVGQAGQLLSTDGSGLVWADPVTPITVENAQDAVAQSLTNTDTINLAYNDSLNQITADLRNLSVGTQHLGDGSVTAVKFRSSSGLSVVGRSANSTGMVADIQATANSNHVLKAGSTLGWGLVDTASIADNAIDGNKLASGVVKASHLSSSNSPSNGYFATYDATNNRFVWVAPPAAYGDEQVQDVVGAMFYNSATINVSYDDALDKMSLSLKEQVVDTINLVDGAVSDAKFRSSAGLSVVGRELSSGGPVGDLVAGTDGHVLRRFGNTLGFGTLDGASIIAASVHGNKLTDGTIPESKLDVLNVPSGGQVFRWNGTSNKPEWAANIATPPEPQDATFTYSSGDLSRIDYADGSFKTFAYVAGRVDTLVHNRGASVVTKTFSYNGSGDLTGIDVTVS